ncbi:MAG: hypothetical protein F7B18_08995 [Desulfurococcales archaeon]|nr:hypothetical protein [Desulfurococcales archaeon]
MPRRKCRYYVNINFFVDLEGEKPEAVAFARRRGLCTSSVLLHEYRIAGKPPRALRLARAYGIRIYKVPVLRLRRRARALLLEWGVKEPSDNTVYDVAHILAAKILGASYFVTADDAACRRAIRLGVSCINHRTGEEYAPP